MVLALAALAAQAVRAQTGARTAATGEASSFLGLLVARVAAVLEGRKARERPAAPTVVSMVVVAAAALTEGHPHRERVAVPARGGMAGTAQVELATVSAGIRGAVLLRVRAAEVEVEAVLVRAAAAAQ